MSIVIAGERSGSGKTTVTLALLAALRARHQPVQSFKVGPDYIDPMFHAHVTDRPCYNLDPVLTSPEYLPHCFDRHTRDRPLAIVEGVMGLFDGAMTPPGEGSTAQVAKMLKLPVLLVVNCQSMSHSIAALVKGYTTLDPDLEFAGLVLNRVGSDRHLEILRAALTPLNIPILGVFKREDSISLPDRHLGLIPTDELPELKAIVDQLAVLGKNCFDWERLTPLLTAAPKTVPTITKSPTQVRIAVARDAAFNFYYAENLELLEQMGAELIYWSPLQDSAVPAEAQGLYFGGGFPEVFAAQLAANSTMRQSVATKIALGTPTYAECGGLMFLTQSITDFEGQSYPMVGSIPTSAVMGKKLTLGYRYATALADTPLLIAGETVRGHEFHRSTLTLESPQPLFTGLDTGEGWHRPHLHASYLHLHWGSNPHWVRRWIDRCDRTG
jgi:cobyrinic acid a,c-diamide synthase